MKTLIQTLLLLFVLTNLTMAQSTKILTRQFPTTSSTIWLDVPSEVVVKKSTEQHPRIYLTIESKLPTQTLDAIVKSGRYNFETVTEGDELIISIPNLARKIIIQGVEVTEKISIEIFLPEHITLKNNQIL